MSADLVLGPVLRYADTTSACLWLEASAACEVTVEAGVLGRHTTRTFEIAGHHYGYVMAEGLPPGAREPYRVLLDGAQVWPAADDARPAAVLRTLQDDGSFELAFGSCRVDRPHEQPYTLTPDQHEDGVGVDALHALSLALQRGERTLPDLLLHLGDQVYADEGLSPRVRQRQVERRGADSEPVDEIADFEEYTWLYRDSWEDDEVRWLLATVPSAMIFDDHDVRDDWNISAAWRAEMADKPWWRERIVGAYMSYWIYQHLGNLAPEHEREAGLLDAVCRDGEPVLREYAERADDEIDQGELIRWSFGRELGAARLVVIDTRSGRVLDEHGRAMLNEHEWELVEGYLRGDTEHLLVASSLPIVLERSLHDLERWNDAVCGGAWGGRLTGLAEKVRQGVDLEHWAAFPESFDRLLTRLGDIAAGRHGRAPATVVMLSGDVHHSYVAPVSYPGQRLAGRVLQVVSSPLRNAVPSGVQRGFAFAGSGPARAVGRALARAASLRRPRFDWHVEHGPLQGNGISLLQLSGRRATLTMLHSLLRGEECVLVEVLRERLDEAAAAA